MEANRRSENLTRWFPRHWLLGAQIAIAFCFCAACNRDTEPGVGAKATQAEGFEAKEARLDSTLWTNELLALRHELTFVQLRDDLVRATNKLAVLQHFEFAEIVLPRDKGTGQILSSILARTYSDASPETLSHSGWEQTIARLRDAGWELRQAEWSHMEFCPASQGKPASSSFEFELDGEHSASARRIILRGKLRVEWAPCLDSTTLVQPRRLAVSN